MNKLTTLLCSASLIATSAACTDSFQGTQTTLEVNASSPSLTLGLRHDTQGGNQANQNGNGNGNNGANVSDELKHAIAVVHAASAHVAGSGWHLIFDGRKTVDFLNLEDSAQDLGFGQIPAGKVTQIRLFILEDEDSYVETFDGTRSPMLTPSGSQSGIKIKGTFRIGECEQGRLTLATDRHNAIHIHGRGGNHGDYILRPVIRVADYQAQPADCDGNPGNNPGDGDNPGGDTPEGDNPGGDGDNPGDNPDGDNPGGDNPDGDNPDGDNPDGDNPGGDNPDGDIPRGDNPGDTDGDDPDGDNIPEGCVEIGPGEFVGADCSVDGNTGSGDGNGDSPEGEICYDGEGGLYDC